MRRARRRRDDGDADDAGVGFPAAEVVHGAQQEQLLLTLVIVAADTFENACAVVKSVSQDADLASFRGMNWLLKYTIILGMVFRLSWRVSFMSSIHVGFAFQRRRSIANS